MEVTSSNHPDNACGPCRAVYDKTNEPSVGFCVQCVEYLCQPCLNHHMRLKATRGHVLLTGNSVPENKTAFEMLEVVGKCPQHPDGEITYECKEHGTFLCMDCARKYHRNCTQLIEIALNETEESDKSSLSQTLRKIDSNAEKLTDLEQQKARNKENIERERTEILDRQTDLKKKLEKALLDIQNQEENVRRSFDSKLSQLNSDINKLQKLRERNKLYRQFGEATLKYGRPEQLYMVVNGRFRHIDEELVNLQAWSDAPSSDMTNIRDDILNLLLAVDVSSHFYENTSDSIDDADTIDEIPSRARVASAACEPLPMSKGQIDASSQRETPSGYRNFIHRDVELSKIINIACIGDSKTCDLVGVAIIESGNIAAIVDYGNTKLKVFDLNFNFLNQKSLHSKPVGICTAVGNQIAVLLVEKEVVIYMITCNEIKQTKSIKLDTYGHSIARYGPHIAVMGANSKFDGTRESGDSPITIDIIDHIHGNVLSRFPEISQMPPHENKKVKLDNPCQIYSRYGTEIFIGTDQDVKRIDKDGKQRWFFHRGRSFRGATGITSDSDNNVYVCGYDSGNIYQIYGHDYRAAKRIISIQFPWSISFDKTNRRLLIACRKNNSLMSYDFVETEK